MFAFFFVDASRLSLYESVRRLLRPSFLQFRLSLLSTFSFAFLFLLCPNPFSPLILSSSVSFPKYCQNALWFDILAWFVDAFAPNLFWECELRWPNPTEGRRWQNRPCQPTLAVAMTTATTGWTKQDLGRGGEEGEVKEGEKRREKRRGEEKGRGKEIEKRGRGKEREERRKGKGEREREIESVKVQCTERTSSAIYIKAFSGHVRRHIQERAELQLCVPTCRRP